jgi:uncharacterized protein (TIGR00255 family)
MMHSMTGFGEARVEAGGQAYQLEIRSFNQRYFKASIHLPEDFAFLENEVERLLRARLTRGSVTLRLYVRDLGSEAGLDFNAAAIGKYVARLREAVGDDPRVTIDLATLLTLPGVCQTRDLSEEERGRWTGLLTKLTTDALDRLIAMRAAEGQALAADLLKHCELVGGCLERIRRRAPGVVTEYRDRLLARIEELIADSSVSLAAEDLLKEVSIYAERSDISEELSRLAGHLEQFRVVMAAPEPAGRKLEFIAQEMLREANTMGSKTGDAEIAREIIEIKGAVDRLKEQVANAE